jgi:transposase
MDRANLEQLLDQGLSLAEIGRRVDRHESTVAYWLQRYDLQACGHARHAPKGALTHAELANLVQAGMSVGQIAETVGRGKATVRHWLQEYGLKTIWAERRQALRDGRREMTLTCAQHGATLFRMQSNHGYRCAKCNTEAVSRRRRAVKRTLVEEAGGACRLCGYDRCIAALEFHHVVRADKRFSMSARGVARSLARARAEASKCVLLCANCHAEVEAGTSPLADRDFAALQCVRVADDYPG